MVEGKDFSSHKKVAEEAISKVLTSEADKREFQQQIDRTYNDISVSTLMNILDSIPETKAKN